MLLKKTNISIKPIAYKVFLNRKIGKIKDFKYSKSYELFSFLSYTDFKLI